MANGRCRMHGGKAKGAPKGNSHAFKHGRYTAEAIAERRELMVLVRDMKDLGRYVAFQMAEVDIPRNLFADILRLIAELRPPPDPTTV